MQEKLKVRTRSDRERIDYRVTCSDPQNSLQFLKVQLELSNSFMSIS